jgi:hypothetical protein
MSCNAGPTLRLLTTWLMAAAVTVILASPAAGVGSLKSA